MPKSELLPADLDDLTVRNPLNHKNRYVPCMAGGVTSLHLQLLALLRCQSCGSSCVSEASLSLEQSPLYYSASASFSFPALVSLRLPSASWVPAWSPLTPLPHCCHQVRAPAQAPALEWTPPVAAQASKCSSQIGESLMEFSQILQTEFLRECSCQTVTRNLCRSLCPATVAVSPAVSFWLRLTRLQEPRVPAYPCRAPHLCRARLR